MDPLSSLSKHKNDFSLQEDDDDGFIIIHIINDSFDCEWTEPNNIPVMIYHDYNCQQISSHNYDQVHPRDYIVLFNLPQYISDIWASHGGCPSKIWRQFCQDYYRITIDFNDCKISDSTQYFQLLAPYWFQTSHLHPMIRTYLLILMLSNQSAFGMPFEVLHNIYTDTSRHRQVVHQNQNQNRRSQIAFKFPPGSDQSQKRGTIEVSMQSVVAIIDTDSGDTLYQISLQLAFDIALVPTTAAQPIGILSWTLY